MFTLSTIAGYRCFIPLSQCLHCPLLLDTGVLFLLANVNTLHYCRIQVFYSFYPMFNLSTIAGYRRLIPFIQCLHSLLLQDTGVLFLLSNVYTLHYCRIQVFYSSRQHWKSRRLDYSWLLCGATRSPPTACPLSVELWYVIFLTLIDLKFSDVTPAWYLLVFIKLNTIIWRTWRPNMI